MIIPEHLDQDSVKGTDCRHGQYPIAFGANPLEAGYAASADRGAEMVSDDVTEGGRQPPETVVKVPDFAAFHHRNGTMSST
jgi:hypothetical protein